MKGNQVTYEIPAPLVDHAKRRFQMCLLIGFLVVASAVGMMFAIDSGSYGARAVGLFLASTLSVLVGVNSVAYEYPISGATAPTAAQIFKHQSMSAIVTGDGSATTFTITHNWNLSTAQLNNGWPWVQLEVILAAGNTAAAVITSKTANTVVFSCTAFTGAGLRVRLERPFSALT
jgi:hypothetical protein